MTGIIIINSAGAWHADSWEEVAERAATGDGQAPGLNYLSLQEVEEMREDGIALPDSALEIARAHGTVCEVQRRHDDFEYVAPTLAPALADVVMDWLQRDGEATALTSRDEALAWLESHPSGALPEQVRQAAWALTWVDDN